MHQLSDASLVIWKPLVLGVGRWGISVFYTTRWFSYQYRHPFKNPKKRKKEKKRKREIILNITSFLKGYKKEIRVTCKITHICSDHYLYYLCVCYTLGILFSWIMWLQVELFLTCYIWIRLCLGMPICLLFCV